MDDADFDVGVAVKEDPSTSSTTGGRDGSSQISGGAPSSSSKKKKRRKKRKRSASEVSEGSQSVAFVTADVKVANQTDVCGASHQYVGVPIPTPGSPETKKRKRKKKKKSKSDKGDETTYLKQEVELQTMGPLKGLFVKERCKLPVYQHRAELCKLVANNDVVLAVAETVSYDVHW